CRAGPAGPQRHVPVAAQERAACARRQPHTRWRPDQGQPAPSASRHAPVGDVEKTTPGWRCSVAASNWTGSARVCRTWGHVSADTIAPPVPICRVPPEQTVSIVRIPPRILVLAAAAALASLLAPGPAASQSPFDGLKARSIGPAVMGGRIQDIEVDPRDPSTIYVAAATGGIWKTTNHGVTWAPIFEGQPDNAFGDLAIFPGDSRIIWAGTGEQNNRQSSSWGGGVYRSTDAGATWTFVGLKKTAAIGRVLAHPTDGNVAWVAAIGNLWKPSPDRGLYKTTDGGKTWAKVLYVDSLTGVTEVVMDPRDPNVLYAATYQRLRSAFGFNGGGPGSAVWKSTDGGASWRKIENGLPAGEKGRTGLAIARSNPNVLIATIEHATGTGTYR